VKVKAALLVALGLAQMLGDVIGSPSLRGLAAATGASPAPKVFSAAQGLETYSSKFYLEWVENSHVRSVELTPELYQKLRGPYNRRNVYGAVLAYGPVLMNNPPTRPMFEQVSKYALCGEAPLLRELGIEPPASPLWIKLEPLTQTPADIPRRLEVDCR
jgi:hypothetical protein